MKVEIEAWQKVYERTTAIVDIPDDELGDDPELHEEEAENYVDDNIGAILLEGYASYEEVVGPDGDTEITVTILKGAE